MARVIAVGTGGIAQAPKRDVRYAGVISAYLAAHTLGELVLSPRCATIEQADDVRRGIHRSCKHYCGCGEAMCTRKYPRFCPEKAVRLGASAEIVRDAKDELRVQFSIFDKSRARAYVIEKYGTDRSLWPYDPKGKKRK